MFERVLAVALCALVASTARAADPPLRDPMQPYRAAPGSTTPDGMPAPRFRLTAVLISPTRSVAIVNGKPYQLGARIDGAELVSIEQSSIRLRDGNEELIVHLGGARAAASSGEGDFRP